MEYLFARRDGSIMRNVILFSALMVGWLAPTVCAHAETEVLDQNGRARKFYSEVLGPDQVVVNFIYTRCEGVCPNQGRRFEQVQTLLKDRLGPKLRLVSVSIDPERDTPENLKSYGEQYHAGENWTLVTGSKAAMEGIAKDLLGMAVNRSEHSPYIAVRTKKGEWQRLYGLTSAKDIIKTLNEG